jgi:metallo-beta-lactamase class B
MKTLSMITLALVVSAAPAHAQTVSDLAAQMRARWNAPSEPFKVIDNVYYVGTAGLASLLVTSPGGHVLVNSGLPEGATLIKASIDKLGFKLTDIKYLLSTEANFDHAGGWAELQKNTGAQMVASAADKPLLEAGHPPGQENNEALRFPKVKVDRVVAQGDKITIGKLTLVAHMTPGQSPGCTTWTTVAREKKWNHTVVFFCAMSAAMNKQTGNSAYPGIEDDYKKSIQVGRGIIADVFLPAHPEMFEMEEKRPLIGKYGVNPFVKASEFHAFVREAEKDFGDPPPQPKPKRKLKWKAETQAGK